jgi:hypothetical protein
MKTLTYKAQLWIDLQTELADKVVHAFSLGFDSKLYVLASYAKDNVQYRSQNGMFALSHSPHPNDYIVYIATPSNVTQHVILNQTWNYHSVQPLLNDELLLVCARSSRKNKKAQNNGHVFSLNGTFKRSFALGDAIQSMQTTSTGEIWTSYFDEGFGQSFDGIQIKGLHRWNANGQMLFQYSPVADLDYIFDCYAMNVDNDDSAWIFYHSQFAIVQIKDTKIINYWHTPLRSKHYICTWNNHALMSGADKKYELYELKSNHSIRHSKTYSITPTGEKTTRGNTVVIEYNNQFYRFGIPELFWHDR